MAFSDPSNDGIDVTTFPYDIEALHGRFAKHAYVVDLGLKGNTVNVVTAANSLRSFGVRANLEELPCFIKRITAGTNVARIRIFWEQQ